MYASVFVCSFISSGLFESILFTSSKFPRDAAQPSRSATLSSLPSLKIFLVLFLPFGVSRSRAIRGCFVATIEGDALLRRRFFEAVFFFLFITNAVFVGVSIERSNCNQLRRRKFNNTRNKVIRII